MAKANDGSSFHWKTPSAIVASLLCGVAFALGHHFWYLSLAGTEAPTGNYNFATASLSKQQLHLAVGTALAFLVKSSLVAAISTAYLQFVWRTAETSSGGTAINVLDTLFAALQNAFALFKLHIWYRYPLIFLLCAIAWLVPIASIVAPATLSVQAALISPAPTSMNVVPTIDFNNLNFAASMNMNGHITNETDSYRYNGPSSSMRHLATAVTSQGQILPIPYPAPNTSYELSFWGPSLSCSEASTEEHNNLDEAIIDQLLDITSRVSNGTAGDAITCDLPGYLAWVPTSINSTDPFSAIDDNATSTESNFLSLTHWTITENSPYNFYVATVPDHSSKYQSNSTFVSSGADGCALVRNASTTADAISALNSTLLKCTFTNASYTANFTFENGVQRVGINRDPSDTLITVENIIGPEAISYNTGPDAELSTALAQAKNPNCSTFNNHNMACVFDYSLLRTISYQSVARSFVEILIGGVMPGAVSSTSQVIGTVLMDTIELRNIADAKLYDITNDLQTTFTLSNGSEYASVMGGEDKVNRGPLKTALEDLFTNITISLMSEPTFLSRSTGRFASVPTKVTVTAYHNIYVYHSATLWTAYGLAIGVTTLASMLGLVSMVIAGGAYENSFSTILRFSRNAHISEEVKDGSTKGPLPKRLARARVLTRMSEMSQMDDLPESAVETHHSEPKINDADTRLLDGREASA